jgi:hypothetical protein
VNVLSHYQWQFNSNPMAIQRLFNDIRRHHVLYE